MEEKIQVKVAPKPRMRVVRAKSVDLGQARQLAMDGVFRRNRKKSLTRKSKSKTELRKILSKNRLSKDLEDSGTTIAFREDTKFEAPKARSDSLSTQDDTLGYESDGARSRSSSSSHKRSGSVINLSGPTQKNPDICPWFVQQEGDTEIEYTTETATLFGEVHPLDISLFWNAKGDVNVKAGTMEKLAEFATSWRRFDPTFLDTFLITYRSFSDPETLMRMLRERFESQQLGLIEEEGLRTDQASEEGKKLEDGGVVGSSSSQQLFPGKIMPRRLSAVRAVAQSAEDVKADLDRRKQIAFRVCNVLKTWVSKYTHDFVKSEPLQQAFHTFIDDVITKTDGYVQFGEQLALLLGRKLTKANINIHYQHSQPMPVPQLEGLGRDFTQIDMFALSAEEVARQLTLYEFSLLKKIEYQELFNQAWTKKATREQKAPHVLAMVNWFNTLTMWIPTAVLRVTNLVQRAKCIGHIIDIARHCEMLNNFAGIMEMVTALQLTPIYRLRRTWAALPDKQIATFKRLQEVMSTEGNYANCRKEIEKRTPPCLPYLGIYLADLIHIEDGYQDTDKEDDRLINFSKCRKLSSVITNMQQWMQSPYCLQEIEFITDYFKNLQPDSEDTLYEASLQAEPRNKGGGGTVSTLTTKLEDWSMKVAYAARRPSQATNTGVLATPSHLPPPSSPISFASTPSLQGTPAGAKSTGPGRRRFHPRMSEGAVSPSPGLSRSFSSRGGWLLGKANSFRFPLKDKGPLSSPRKSESSVLHNGEDDDTDSVSSKKRMRRMSSHELMNKVPPPEKLADTHRAVKKVESLGNLPKAQTEPHLAKFMDQSEYGAEEVKKQAEAIDSDKHAANTAEGTLVPSISVPSVLSQKSHESHDGGQGVTISQDVTIIRASPQYSVSSRDYLASPSSRGSDSPRASPLVASLKVKETNTRSMSLPQMPNLTILQGFRKGKSPTSHGSVTTPDKPTHHPPTTQTTTFIGPSASAPALDPFDDADSKVSSRSVRVSLPEPGPRELPPDSPGREHPRHGSVAALREGFEARASVDKPA